MYEDKINSNESEGVFNDYIDEKVSDMIDEILNEGQLDSIGERGSEIVVEGDDITVPTFSYGGEGDGQGGGGQGPGKAGGKLRFSLPFHKFMELIAEKLNLPNLVKEGKGKIKQVSYEFKTFAPSGVSLDKKRTFKRSLRTSIGLGSYDPANKRYLVNFHRRDRRFKVPLRVEKPRFKAVVFYIGDISYSTHGERLASEKRIVNFIKNWLDFNYGERNVDHRFFVHDIKAYEVMESEFYTVGNVGGTRAAIVFDLVYQIAFGEYDTSSTNFYAFYFGDGEIFGTDGQEIADILKESICPVFNRVGIVEVFPSQWSKMIAELEKNLTGDGVLRLARYRSKTDTVPTIRKLFAEEGRTATE